MNETVLRAALEATETHVLGDVTDIYRTLTDPETNEGVRTETRAWLSRAGVATGTLAVLRCVVAGVVADQ